MRMTAQTLKHRPLDEDVAIDDVASFASLPGRDSASNQEPRGVHHDHVYDSIVDLAPGPDNPTPMVRLGNRINPHPDLELLIKLEGMNAFGSIKDRTALYMLRGLHLK